MRVLENFELPDSVMELLVNSAESAVAVDAIEEAEILDEESLPSKEEEEAEILDEESLPGKEEEESEDKSIAKKIDVSFKVDPKQPKMIRMANLSVVGGYSVNGVAEIHSEIVRTEVFSDFYEVSPNTGKALSN